MVVSRGYVRSGNWLTMSTEFQFCIRRKSGGQLLNNIKVAHNALKNVKMMFVFATF